MSRGKYVNFRGKLLQHSQIDWPFSIYSSASLSKLASCNTTPALQPLTPVYKPSEGYEEMAWITSVRTGPSEHAYKRLGVHDSDLAAAALASKWWKCLEKGQGLSCRKALSSCASFWSNACCRQIIRCSAGLQWPRLDI